MVQLLFMGNCHYASISEFFANMLQILRRGIHMNAVVMRVAAVEFFNSLLNHVGNKDKYMQMIEDYIARAADDGVDLLVFPGFTGCFYQLMELNGRDFKQAVAMVCHRQFIHSVLDISRKYALLICPGSYWERQGEDVFHASCLVKSGQVLLEQRQLYLAKWERELGLSRGIDVELIEINGWKIGIMLATDVFYPQVARKLALMGARLVVSPVGFVGDRNAYLQLSGVWQKAQLNHFFAVESAFNGRLGTKGLLQENSTLSWAGGDEEYNVASGCKMLWGESIIYAPLPMTPQENGILKRTSGKIDFITADLDRQGRRQALKEFNALAQLNPGFYTKIRRLGGQKAADN